LNKRIEDVNKTGLGSSAALVTALVAVLCRHFNLIERDASSTTKHIVHALAQFSHCIIQGKIGSGFDISAAVYGSHSYLRFDKATLQPFMNSFLEDPQTVDFTSLLDARMFALLLLLSILVTY
jgi:phosphomevalonate kinase